MSPDDQATAIQHNADPITGLRNPYSRPSLLRFGSVASVTGSNKTGSFFDTMTSKVADTNKAPMDM